MDVIINWSKAVNFNQISSLCLVVASIEEEKQNELISKIDWVLLLNKLNIKHSIQIRVLTYILNYQNKKYKILFQTEEHEAVMIYLSKNIDNIIYFSTHYFIVPDDFQTCANLLKALYHYSLEKINKISEKLKYKIIDHFFISPRYYQSFSNILSAIHQIDPVTSNFIINNNLVWEKLYDSFQVEDFNDQLIGLQSLVKTINNINPTKYTKITELQFIKDIDISDNS